jgi:hypothetical protein
MLLVCVGATSRAQEIEPRAYSNAPVGVNFLIAGFAYTTGSPLTDPSLPITDAKIETSNAVVAYVRTLDLWGKSGKFDMNMPYTWLSGTARLDGEPLSREIAGNGSPAFRLSVNLYGAPALTRAEFASYRQDLIVGASLQVIAPWSQYDSSRLVNIGTNRWLIKPQVGVSKVIGQWTLEATAAVTLYTDNDDFYGGSTRSQDPLYALQAHTIYAFRSGIWTSLDATWFTGGRTSINDSLNADLQQNWRVGATLAIPVNARNSVKFYASSGVSARTDNNFDLLGVAWQYRWGGGI